jgi:succinate--hydroxymethylglutarate CoA-transferase
VPYGGYETKDGKVMFIAANNNRQWKGFCQKINIPGLAEDTRFSSNDGRVSHREEITAILEKAFRQKTKAEWLELFEGSGLPYGAINDVVEAVEHPQAAARNMIVDVDDFQAARDGVLKLIGPAMKFDGANMGVRIKPPLLGEHTDEVLNGLGYGTPDVAELRKSGVI